jgi:hypothetical protein
VGFFASGKILPKTKEIFMKLAKHTSATIKTLEYGGVMKKMTYFSVSICILLVSDMIGVPENLIQKRTCVSEYGTTESWTLWRFMGMWGYYPAGGAGRMVLIHFKNDRVDSIS